MSEYLNWKINQVESLKKVSGSPMKREKKISIVHELDVQQLEKLQDSDDVEYNANRRRLLLVYT